MIYGICFFISLLVSIILLRFLYKVRNAAITKYLIYITSLVSFWILMETLSYFIKITDLLLFFQKAKYISVILVSPLFYLASNEFVQKKKSNYFNVNLIFIVPIINLISLISAHFPYKYLSDCKIVYENGIYIFTYTKNMGYWINTVYSYSIVMVACYLLMIRAIKSPKIYRRQSIFIFLGTMMSFITNVLFISNIFGSSFIDTTSISILITMMIFYLGVFIVPQYGIVPFARDLVIETIKDGVIILDTSDNIIDANPAAVEFIKCHRKKNTNIQIDSVIDLRGMQISELISAFPNLRTVNTIGDSNNDSILTFNYNGKNLYFITYEEAIYDIDKAKIGKLFMFHDITEMQEYMNNLEYLNKELVISDKIINETVEGVLITDSSANIIRVNNSFQRMSGYTKEEVIGKNPRMFKSDRHDINFYKNMWDDLINMGHWEGEIWDRRKNGEIYPKWMSITSIKQFTESNIIYIAISSDISKIKNTENALQNLAYYDSLTGIPNRTLFYERLQRALVNSKRSGKAVALLFMDLDGFKVINDTMGHAAGDLLLIEVANRIKANIRESDTVSRLGGDEFTIILEDIKNPQDVKRVAESVMKNIVLKYNILDREVTVGVSIGIALAPNDETTVEGLVRKADAAMYHAKESGRGRYAFSSEEIEIKNRELLEMQINLNSALINNEFQLYLQPQIAFIENKFKIVGAEALIRWNTRNGEIFTPDKFIPIVEGNGMIVPIGNWILREIFRINKLLKENEIDIKLSINVSPKQFQSGNFVSTVKRCFEKNKSQNINLIIEITESFLIQNIEKAIESLLKIKDMGIGISLDDFGTGFSSLSYLTRLPIDYLKIDKSFIDDFGNNQHRNLTSTIISMAKTLDLKTVAEGVETKEQVDKLINEQCTEFQGYYFSKPLKIEEFIKYAKKII